MDSDWVFRLIAVATSINSALLGLAGFFAPRIAAHFKATGDLAAVTKATGDLAAQLAAQAAEHARFREETRLEIERLRLQAAATARAVADSDHRTAAMLAELKDDVRDGLAEVKQRLDLFLQQTVAALPAAPRRRPRKRADG